MPNETAQSTIIYQSLVVAYSKAIYLNGTKRFADILPDYVTPVKQYAATNFTSAQIDNALAQEWINQQEYADTIALV